MREKPKNGKPRPPRVSSEILDQKPPSDVKAERQLLASIMLDPPRRYEVLGIHAETFYDPRHGILWEHLENMPDDVAADSSLLVRWLEDAADLSACGGIEYITEIAGSDYTAANAKYYADIVVDRAIKRQIRGQAEGLLQLAQNPTVNASDLRAELAAAMETIPEPSNTLQFPALTCAELMGKQFAVRYLVKRILVEGQPLIIAGPKKALKTTLICALAIALATGFPFLGMFEIFTVLRVGIMTGESGLATIKETLRRIAESMSIDPGTLDNIILSEKLPQLDSVAHLEALRRFILKYALKVLVLDPAYMMMSGAEAGNLFVQGQLLRGITELCQELGCTLVICHHTKRNIGRNDQYSPPELEDIAWAGFQEWARQWLLLARREAYQPGSGLHRLWMTTGGSAGHGGLWALDVAEGTSDSEGGRFWQVDVMTADEARESHNDHKQEAKRGELEKQLDADRQIVVTAAVKVASETKNGLRDRVGIGHARYARAFASLVADGTLQPATVIRENGHQYEGWKLRNE